MKKGNLINEGKTKRIYDTNPPGEMVIIQNKDDITAFDNPAFTKEFKNKGMFATTTTANVFNILKRAGINTHFVQRLDEEHFLAKKCTMLPLEAVARRYATGSYLKRNPQIDQPQSSKIPVPNAFLTTEYFLKTSGKKFISAEDTIIYQHDAIDDPLISFMEDSSWLLRNPKIPTWNANSKIGKIPSLVNPQAMRHIDQALRTVFYVIEGALRDQSHTLVDIKVEFGLLNSGCLVVADVIDNCSWRILDPNGNDISKESYRRGTSMETVARNYKTVADLSETFVSLGGEGIVLWNASRDDADYSFMAELSTACKNLQLHHEIINLSGHKSPVRCLRKLREYESRYTKGGVIITHVGRSNGLAPMLAARTSWPVISAPATLDAYPEDIWSNVRMPSNVPVLTTSSLDNALIAAINILSRGNPFCYAHTQKRIEGQDDAI